MDLLTLLDLAADAHGDRPALGGADGRLTYAALRDRARRLAGRAAAGGAENLVYVGLNSPAVPIALFGAAAGGVPFVPLNYRLSDGQLRRLVVRTAPSLVVAEEAVADRIGPVDGVRIVDPTSLLSADGPDLPAPSTGPSLDDVAVLLFTSGTTGEPKAAVLRHRHLSSYVLSTVAFGSADEAEATLVSVPPYHVAGVMAVLSAVHAGRRLAYLPAFTPDAWVDLARDERATHAMVVPTMLGRILDVLDRRGERLPALRHLSYGGGRMPVALVKRALATLPTTGFVNAYGLTETSSTLTVLGPDDHREAIASADPVVQGRLASVGRPLPGVQVEIRDGRDGPVPPGTVGEIWVRGEQVAGEYLGRDDALRDDWFPTNDGGWIDADGYLYVTGRLDDVIVRGGENLSPGEIEDVLVAHPEVEDAAVVGLPDPEWGEQVVAAVVPVPGASPGVEELRDWVRAHLRSPSTPTQVHVVTELPYNETGKLLRRVLRAELLGPDPGPDRSAPGPAGAAHGFGGSPRPEGVQVHG